MYLKDVSSNDSKLSTDDSNTMDSSCSSECNKAKFIFPPPPRLWKSADSSSHSSNFQSDSSLSDGRLIKIKKKNKRRYFKLLPPIGVFWDIENCQVPKNKSASSVVQRIRELFSADYREAEFIVVCDVKKENAQIVQELNDAQVNLIHISSTSKNAADEKLRQSLRRFAEIYSPPAAIVLISSDVNFAADLSDLRYRKKIHVILLHNSNIADALILCANETYCYASITEAVPLVKNKPTVVQPYDIVISNLPIHYQNMKIRNRLKLLSDNCGGRVVQVNRELGLAILRFSSLDFAKRVN